MTPARAFDLTASYLAVYLFVLAWNMLAAAASFTRRTRLRGFPFGRCLFAAAGPTLLPIGVIVVLSRWGFSGDVKYVALFPSWGLSFWLAGQVERRLPGSPSAGETAREIVRKVSRDEDWGSLTQVQSYGFMILGVLKGWLSLTIGVVAGYGVAAVISRAGLPFRPPSMARLATPGPVSVVIFYAMLGFLIEALRFQRNSDDPPRSVTWPAARGLRLGLLACLAGWAACIGVYAGLYW